MQLKTHSYIGLLYTSLILLSQVIYKQLLKQIAVVNIEGRPWSNVGRAHPGPTQTTNQFGIDTSTRQPQNPYRSMTESSEICPTLYS